MENAQPRFLTLAAKTVVSHTLTYFVMGALAFHFLHYADFINNPNSGMRPMTSPLVMLGPALQVVRGVLFAAVFYPFREILFERRNGWLLLAWMLIGVGIQRLFRRRCCCRHFSSTGSDILAKHGSIGRSVWPTQSVRSSQSLGCSLPSDKGIPSCSRGSTTPDNCKNEAFA